jgi:hypothetical protein
VCAVSSVLRPLPVRQRRSNACFIVYASRHVLRACSTCIHYTHPSRTRLVVATAVRTHRMRANRTSTHNHTRVQVTSTNAHTPCTRAPASDRQRWRQPSPTRAQPTHTHARALHHDTGNTPSRQHVRARIVRDRQVCSRTPALARQPRAVCSTRARCDDAALLRCRLRCRATPVTW